MNNFTSTTQDVKSHEVITPISKERTVYIDNKKFTVVSVFEGTETASKLIYDMAVNRVLNESASTLKNLGKADF
jgi:hypothetical protein